ncbi:MAG: TonB-dependent outer membrane protein SusC/RagA [Gemmatimonadetes bacterium]|nr:TonB-dependent outer membrane protein SusC/RagA [Gemmatimonadota bacterium]
MRILAILSAHLRALATRRTALPTPEVSAMHVGRRTSLFSYGAALFLLAVSSQALHAQGGTVTGRVTASGTNEPLSQARVLVIGTSNFGITGDDGKFTIRGVRAGAADVQVLRVGYLSRKQAITVTNGGTVTSDFTLAKSVIQLDEVVTTATGQQRKVELGNAVATLGDVNKRVEESVVNNITDLLIAKSPGVVLLPSPVLGGAPTIRVRGISSISLSNAPIWYVDGVRWTTTTGTSSSVFNSTGAPSSSGSTPISPLNNLSPEEIEDIEIVKGPSAATLYGTNAANGVIVVTTKKGRPGQARWTYTGETRTVSDRWDYQDQYANFGKSVTTGKVVRCQLPVMVTAKFTAAQGATCTSDSVSHYDYLSDPENTFIHLGRGSLLGANVSGGTDALRYFVSGDVDNEFGPIQMAQRDIDYYQSIGTQVTNSMLHPRQQQKVNLRTNLSAAVSSKLDITVNSGFSKSSNLIEPDNSAIIGLLYTGQSNYGYKGCPGNVDPCGLDKPSVDNTGFPLHDANSFNPGSIMQYTTPVDAQRFTGSIQANWRPLTWLQNDGTVGVDLLAQDIVHICRLNECPNSGATSRVGNIYNQKDDRRNLSAKISSNATWQPKPWANFRTTVGGDYTNEERDQLFAQGRNLPPGASTLQASATFISISAIQPSAVKTLGYYAQELLSLRDRLFITVAARQDQNSAFGTNFQNITYPKISASWLVSDESFFKKPSWLDQVRVRSAYGANGVQPLPTAALQTFSPTTVNIATKDLTTGTDQPGLVANQPGNANLKPERSTELEMGFESDFLSRRLHLDYTYYKKKTTDALISTPIPLSVAAPVTTLTLNLGSTQNSGHELQVNAVLIDSKRATWDMTFSASHNDNEWLDLGIDPATGLSRIIGAGTVTQQRKGYPLNAQWYRNYTFADANGDGVIQRSEVAVDSALSFQGVGFAKNLISIASGLDLFNRKLHVNVLFDHKGGGRTLEGNYFQCSSAPLACQENQDPTTDIALQARAVAVRLGTTTGGNTYTTRLGYFVPFDFWKLREISAVATLPDLLSSRLHASSSSSITFGVRNLWTFARSGFTGVDPEQNYGTGSSEVNSDFNTSPTPTYFSVRLNLKY